jgi:hypothetical protein
MFSKHFLEYWFVSLVITSTISGVQNNSQYSRGLLGSCNSTFIPGLPVNKNVVTQHLTWTICNAACNCCHWHFLLHQSWHSVHHLTKFSHLFHCHYYIHSQKYHYIHSFATIHLKHLLITHSHLAKTCHNVYSQYLESRTAIKQSAPSSHILK